MGQRLVIEVVKNQQRIATLYYHWGAYTSSALKLTSELLDYILTPKRLQDIPLSLIHYAEKCGGGISWSDWNYIQNLYPNENFKVNANRNDGLVSLSEQDMQSTIDWSEGTITIDLDNDRIANNVMCWYPSWDEYVREMDVDYPLPMPPIIDINIELFSFQELDEMIDFVNDNSMFISATSNELYQMIE